MKYVGGKHRFQKQIVQVINHFIQQGQDYYEPFVGGAWITQNISNRKVYASDIDVDIIMLYQALQRGEFEFPERISREEYYRLRDLNLNHGVHSALMGFVKTNLAFGGDHWAGYATEPSKNRNFAKSAATSLTRQMMRLMHVEFSHRDYRDLKPSDAFIYCDPPYGGCAPRYVRNFDHSEFWDWVREMSQHNTVLVSEYTAPDDFECVLEIPTRLEIHKSDPMKQAPVERVFKLRDHAR